MNRVRAFAGFLLGSSRDPYSYLLAGLILGIWITSGWRSSVLFVVEGITVVVRLWTRDLVREREHERTAD